MYVGINNFYMHVCDLIILYIRMYRDIIHITNMRSGDM